MIDLSVNFAGLKLKNPVILASGVWDLPYTKIIDFKKLGGVIYKGLSLMPKEGNPPPRITEIPCGVINSIGLANKGIKVFNREVLPELKELGTEVFLNIFGESIEEFSKISSLIRDVSGIEVNISCPNVEKGGVYFGRDPETAYQVTKAVCENTDLPVIVKLTPAASDIVVVAEACQEAGACAITAVNTFPGLVIDIDSGKPLFERVVGGVSGPAIKPLALYKVYEVSSNVGIPVIGSGGIGNYEDVLEYFFAGATAIQLGSVIFNNPLAPIEIVDNITKYAEEKGYSNLKEIRRCVDE